MSSNAPDISELSAAQQEALQNYTAITDQDPVAAIPLLQRSEWNVQIAVTRFFEGEPTSDPVAEAQAAAAAVPAPTSRTYTNLQYEALLAESRPTPRQTSPADTAPRIDTSPSNLTLYQAPTLLSVLFTPFNILFRVFSSILSPFSFLIPPFLSRLISNIFSQPARPTRRALPPADTAQRFVREFNETYARDSDVTLPWAETGYNLALDNAKNNQKFLLVVLISPTHDETHNYITETLLSTRFKEFLDTHRDEMILWGGNLHEPEAYQVSTALSCSKFPFAALICQTPTSPSSTSATGGNMTVITRLVGPMEPSEYVAKLGTAMTSHQAALRAARAQRAEQQAQRSLREEQDSAYERSLAQDRERARKRREEEESKATEEKAALRKQEEIEMLKRKKQQWKRWRAQSLPGQPGPDVKDAIRVSIRMLDGERVIRKFSSGAEMEELYAVVECYEVVKGRESGEIDVEDEKDVEEPEDYEHEYQFQLVSPMPRTVYVLSDGGGIAERVGKGANLIVEALDEEGDEAGEEESST